MVFCQLAADDAQLADHSSAAQANIMLLGNIVKVDPAAILGRHDSLRPQNNAVFSAVQLMQSFLDLLRSKLLGSLYTPGSKDLICMMIVVIMTTAAMSLFVVMMLMVVVVSAATVTLFVVMLMIVVVSAATVTLFVMMLMVVVVSTATVSLFVMMLMVVVVSTAVVLLFLMVMMTTAMDCSVSGMQINGGIKGQVLMGLVEIANGRFFKGLKMMLTK